MPDNLRPPDSAPPADHPQEAIERAPLLPGEGTLWIRCKAYRAHRAHHRRDTDGLWRCFLCRPYGEVAS